MGKFVVIVCLLVVGCACRQASRPVVVESGRELVAVPEFNADSAWRYAELQVAFGPRVPGTGEHAACGGYLAGELRRFGAEVVVQEAVVWTYDRRPIGAKNIVASFDTNRTERVLLCAHWDSRPFADQDPDVRNHRKAISGANDGAGACGALLEIARQIGLSRPSVGVDIVLFDVEDYGTPAFDQAQYGNGHWCLGSQYWAQHPHVENYKAKYGILLDMVSATGARFYKEYFSMQYAGRLVNRIWDTAHALGYGEYFVRERGSAVTDDHLEVFKYLKIPCIDIIQYDPNTSTGFGDYWHTVNDTMERMSRETLRAVGQTVLYVVYNEG